MQKPTTYMKTNTSPANFSKTTLVKAAFIMAAFLFGRNLTAQVNLANYDFNGGTSYPIAPVSTASNITSSINGTETNAAYSGTATGSSAFVQNTTAGNSLSMSGNDNTNTWTLTLGGSDLNKYINYKLYLQSEHSSTGATAITISWSTDGTTFTALSQTVAPGLNTTYAEAIVDLSGVSQINNASAVYLLFSPSGATGGSGTIRIDNLQIQAATSPWTVSGGNVNFTGGVTATSFTTTGDAKINGNLTANGISATSTSLSVTNPVVFSNTIKNTNFAGTGSRLLLTDANGLVSPLAQGTSAQVLFGNGTWGALPVSTFTTSGSNAYFTGGYIGIGNSTPSVPLDVTGNANVSGSIKTASLNIGSLAGNSGGGFTYVDSTGNLRVVPGTGTNIALCNPNQPTPAWMIGGNTLGSTDNAVIGPCDNHDFVMQAHGTSYLWLKTDGRFGIGKSPDAGTQLTILANGANAGLSIENSSQNIFKVANNGNTTITNSSVNSNPALTVIGASDAAEVVSFQNAAQGYAHNASTFLTVNAPYGYSYNALVKAGDNALIFDDGTGGNGQDKGFVIGAWNEGGTHGLRIDGNTGNIGIGTSDPHANLDINISGTDAGLNISKNGNNVFNVANDGSTTIPILGNSNSETHELLVDNNGKLVLGAVSSINANQWLLGGNNQGNIGSNGQSIGTTDATDLPFITNNTEQMRITADGRVVINSLAASHVGALSARLMVAMTNSDPFIDAFTISNFDSHLDYFEVKNNGTVYIRDNDPNDNSDMLFMYGSNSAISFNLANETNIKSLKNFNFITGSANNKLLTIGLDGSATIYKTNSSTPFSVIDNSNLASPKDLFKVNGDGSVCIGNNGTNGVIPSGYMLAIYGSIITEEVKVKLRQNWPDYVFNKDYKLKDLTSLENYINNNHHLPNIPAASEIKENGMQLGDMVTKQMEKIEELTLYLIDMKKQLDKQNEKIEVQSKKIETLEKENKTLKATKNK